MPCLMKTWSRLSSVICGRNECRLKRVTGGGQLPPRISRQQFNKQNPGGAIGGALSCQLLTHARQQTASYSITRPLYRPVAKRDGVRPHRVCLPESDRRAKIKAVRCLSKSPV